MRKIPTRSKVMDKYQQAQDTLHSSEKALYSLTELERFVFMSEPPSLIKRWKFRRELRKLLNTGVKTVTDNNRFTNFLHRHILKGKMSIASITLSDAIIVWNR